MCRVLAFPGDSWRESFLLKPVSHLSSGDLAPQLLICPYSYFRRIGFCLCRLPHLDTMEVSNEVEHKGCPVLSNGTRHSVSSVQYKGF